MKLIWLTDIHLNFLDYEMRLHFYQELLQAPGDKILITGDIAEAPSISSLLKEMLRAINKPIYFVLGNHDYYRGQVDEVRKEITGLTQKEKLLHWLSVSGPQYLGDDIVLLGQDGWADGRYGDYTNSRVSLNDSRLIADLFQGRILGKYQLLEKMQQLADKDANKLQVNLADAITKHHPKKIIILTHVPPFKEACLHEGKMSNDDFLPFFASKATGDVLIGTAKNYADIEFLALCGHTHSKAHLQPLDNLTVKVGAAEYMEPTIQECITL